MDDAKKTSLIRLAVDDELTPEQSRVLEAMLAAHPADMNARMAFERRLRDAVRRCMMEQATVPIDLPERIRALIAAEAVESQETAPLARLGAAAVADTLDADAPRHHSSPLSNLALTRPRWLPRWAMAAGIMLLIGVSVVIGVLGDALSGNFRSGFERASDRGTLPVPPVGAPLTPHQERVVLALDADQWSSSRMLTRIDDAREFIRQNLELPLEVVDLSAFEYRFDGLAVKRVRDPELGVVDYVIDLRYVATTPSSATSDDNAADGVPAAESLHLFAFANPIAPEVVPLFAEAPRPRAMGRAYLIEIWPLPGQYSSGDERSFFAWIDPASGLEKWFGPVDAPGAHAMALQAGMPGGPVLRLPIR